MHSLGQMRRISSLSALLGIAACAPSAPEDPTWAADVAPILAANCVRCHTVPASGGAPAAFRLDVYDDWVDDEGRVIRGAGTMASYIASRAGSERNPMPPTSDIYTHQIDTLAAWAQDRGTDGRAARGAPLADNRQPVMTLETPLDQLQAVDGILTLSYLIDDPDDEIVLGVLQAIPEGADDGQVLTRGLHSGRGTARWDVGAAAPGNYRLEAALTDPSGTDTSVIATYVVPDTGNRAPVVTIDSPVRDDILATAAGDTTEIAISIADADLGDILTVKIEAWRAGEAPVVIANDEPAIAGANTVSWRFADLAADPSWHLRVTVSDGTATRTVDSGPFIIGKASTDDTFESIKDLLGRCTACHTSSVIVPGLDHDFGIYRQEVAGGPLGVYELRGQIYRRAVQERTMPPVSFNIPFDSAALDRLRNWLLAGAPEQ